MGIQNVLGVNYPYPDVNDKPWGEEHIDWATAVSDATNTLQTEVNGFIADLADKVETSSNSGIGSGLALPKVGVDLPFKSLIGGGNITLTADATSVTISATGTGGDVVGPASAVDEQIAVFDGITGKLIKDGGYTIADILALTGAGTVTNFSFTNANGITGIVTNPTDLPDLSLSIDNDAITYAQIQNVTTNKLLGRATAGSGDIEEITLGTGLSYTGTTLNVTAGVGTVTSVDIIGNDGIIPSGGPIVAAGSITLDLGAITPNSVASVGTVTGSNLSGTNTGDQTITLTGDVTGSGTGSFAATIANDAVTFAKFQNITTARLLGRATAGSGDMEEITLGTGLSYTGTTLNASAVSSSGSVISFSMGNGVSATASTTSYNAPSAINLNGTEANRKFVVTAAGTVKNLYLVTTTAQPASGSLVVTVRKNAAATALTLTVAASAAAGTFSDVANSFSVAAGDLLSFQYVNNATAAAADMQTIGVLFI